MEDITVVNNCNNMGGFKAVYISPITEVKSISTLDSNKRSVVFETSGSFGQIEMHDISFNSTPEGDAWNHVITGKIRTSDTLDATLQELSRKRFIAKVVGNNGKSYLVGTKEDPLRFIYTSEGPAGSDDDKNYNITIAGITTEPRREFV